MNKLKTLLLLFATAMATTAGASRAVGLPRAVTLQDGQQVTVKLVGDENLHFLVTTEGDVVVQDNDTYRLATLFEVETLRTKARKIDAENRARMAEVIAPTSIKDEGIYDNKPFPHTGKPKVLTIMVNFSDYQFEYSKEDADKLFNGKEYNTTDKRLSSYGSVAQYFDDCSNGKFRPQFDIVGPVTLDKGAKYYGKGDDNATELLLDACNAAAEQGVDFSQYDSDGDGYVDLVYIYFAGYGANWGADNDFFWPKAGYNSGLTKKYNGKRLYRFAFNQELFAYPDVEQALGVDYKPRCGIGVMVHEFSHCLGLPDFYPTETWLTSDGKYNYDVEKYDNQSMEIWDLMDDGSNLNNGFDPIPYSAWEKELMGWTEKMQVLDSRQDVTLQPLKDGGAGVRVVNDSDPEESESWILENVPAGEGWYRSVPAGGMIVTHLDYDKKYFSYLRCPNNVVGHPRVTVIPADGKLLSGYRNSLPTTDRNYMTSAQLRRDRKGDPFPQTGETLTVNMLTDYRAYRGTMDKPITNIVRNDDGSVSFKFMGGRLLMGDVNGDGVITAADANAAANYCIDKTSATIDTEAADMNSDGEITLSDANAIANEYVKTVTEE